MGVKELQRRMITVYGGVQLRNKEKLYLMLGPDFTVTEDLDMVRIRKDFQTTQTKVRWGRMGRDPEEVVRFRTREEEELEDKLDRQEHLDRRV